MGQRSEVLAARLEQGVRELTALARTLTDEQWTTKIPHDGRTVGVVVHHVGTMYPIEIELAQKLGAGQAVEGVTWDAVHEINANHAREHAACTKEEAIALVEKNSAAAAAAVRALSDEQLDTAAGLSLNSDGPRTCQFMLEDHAVGHAWHHLLKIRRALGAPSLKMSERADAAVG
ncbi:MAG TPA: DinB family protein [Gemmatimonadaceae bacterium]